MKIKRVLKEIPRRWLIGFYDAEEAAVDLVTEFREAWRYAMLLDKVEDKLPLQGEWMIYKGHSFRVVRSEKDGEFVGLCAELPGLSCLSKDYTHAFLGIIRVVEDDEPQSE